MVAAETDEAEVFTKDAALFAVGVAVGAGAGLGWLLSAGAAAGVAGEGVTAEVVAGDDGLGRGCEGVVHN